MYTTEGVWRSRRSTRKVVVMALVATGALTGSAQAEEPLPPGGCTVAQTLTVNNDSSTPSPSPLFGGSDGVRNGPYGVAVDDIGNTYVADPSSSRAYRFGPDGTQTLQRYVRGADGVAVDAAGNIFVSGGGGSLNSFVTKLSPTGAALSTVRGYDLPPGEGFQNSRGIAVDDTAGLVYFAASGGATRIYVTDLNLAPASTEILVESTAAVPPASGFGGVAVDLDGNIYAAGSYEEPSGVYHGIVYKFAPDGSQTMTITDTALSRRAWGVAVDDDNNIYVADGGPLSDTTTEDGAFYGFDASGSLFLSVDNSAGIASPAFIQPRDIAVSPSGEQVYVTDYWSRTLYRFDLDCNRDSDGDGVSDDVDVCPATVLPDEPTDRLGMARFAAQEDGSFDAGIDRLDGLYTLADTGGCSGAQIIDELDLGEGHTRFGISKSALTYWISTLS